MARPLWLMALFFLLVACTPGEEPLSDGEITDSDIDLDEVINFPDPKMESFIRDRAYLSDDEPITVRKVRDLLYLECISCGITDLTGLEKMPWVRELHLGSNNIQSLEPLKDLQELEYINVSGGTINDISPLAGKTKLKTANISGTKNIVDVSFLSSLEQIEELYLNGNKISDIAPLSTLNGLKVLGLSQNKIEDIASAKSLLSLQMIDVEGNCIADFSPVEYLKQNGNLTTIYGDSAEEQDYARCQ